MSGALAVGLLLSYLLGSIPFGYLAGRLCGVDLRREGSGNIGATNTMRVLGKRWGYPVFLLDFAKGVVPVVLLGQLVPRWTGEPVAEGWLLAAGVLSIVGHNFPVWLRFRGGKGIATSAGVIAALYPLWYFLGALAFWWILLFSFRFVSLASIGAGVALIVLGIVVSWLGGISYLLGGVSILIGLLGLWRHRSNMARLRAGTEPRFSCSAKSTPESTNPGKTQPPPSTI